MKKSNWFLIVTDKDEKELFDVEKIHLREKKFTKEIKQRMMRPGKTEIKFILKNDSFRGFDKSHVVEIIVD